jgi:hypothetical protein
MKPDVLLELLEATAETLTVRVSYEALHASVGAAVGHGGLCRVRGEHRVIIDKRATPQERVATLAAALAMVANEEQLAAQPSKVRDAIAFYSLKPGPKTRKAS